MTPTSSERARLEGPRRPAAAPTHRMGDDRYCAPCGVLFWSVAGAEGAAAHRSTAHPEQAHYEALRAALKLTPPASTFQEIPHGRQQ